MATLKKKLELDENLVQRIQNIFGNTVSFTALVSTCLEELVAVYEEENVHPRTLLNKAMRQSKDALSISSEIQSSDE